MNCQTTKDLLNAHSDGELDVVNHLAIEEHLGSCEGCSRVFENHNALKSAMADDSLYFNAPPDLRDRIRQSLPNPSASETSDPPRAAGIWIWRLVPALAIFGVIVILALLFVRPG